MRVNWPARSPFHNTRPDDEATVVTSDEYKKVPNFYIETKVIGRSERWCAHQSCVISYYAPMKWPDQKTNTVSTGLIAPPSNRWFKEELFITHSIGNHVPSPFDCMLLKFYRSLFLLTLFFFFYIPIYLRLFPWERDCMTKKSIVLLANRSERNEKDLSSPDRTKVLPISPLTTNIGPLFRVRFCKIDCRSS